ncbi:MAG: fluoride efflux transporter CrcB [Dehalogenimonas sp.]|uniref:Fluoride-specific ion channel FluC n=1 Tax=Candidatus Dehalogenimonas loeffleri TaxID=3127115 RepID=A0ABZ2J7S7_9CHLR|nr:fluoride efflux transporter CrcB [Dehalogenimonas sp.]
MNIVLMIGVAGALGAVSRYALSGSVYALLGQSFAYGTLVVNVLGSLAIGLVMQLGIATDMFSPNVRTAVAVGFLGAFTTFSTFSYETVQMIQDGAWGPALLNILANVTICIIAVLAGVYLGKLIGGGA